MNKHFLITGSNRSGTTYVGRVIAKSRHYTYLHEPCNHLSGLEGVNHAYPYVSGYYKNLFDEFFKLNYKFKIGPKSNSIKYLIKSVVGNRVTVAGRYYKFIAKNYSNMLLKDPLASFLSDYFHEKHNVFVLVLVRHPMAFTVSRRRMGWQDFDFNHFLSQEKLIEDYLDEEKELMERQLSNIEENGLLWRCVYKVLHDYNKRNQSSERWLVMRHEDICLNPYESFEKICDFLGIAMGDKMKRFIAKTTRASVIQPDNKQYTHLYRDSKKLAYHWKEKVSRSEVDVIRSLTDDIVKHYYDAESWEI